MCSRKYHPLNVDSHSLRAFRFPLQQDLKEGYFITYLIRLSFCPHLDEKARHP